MRRESSSERRKSNLKTRERTEGQRERETWEVDDRVNQTERERARERERERESRREMQL